MCLYTQQTDAKKAKVPIICYKTALLVTDTETYNMHTMHPVKHADCSVLDPVLRSMYYGFQYRLNQLYRCKDFKTSTLNFVNEGFHSYKNEARAQKECDTQDEVVLKCRIPRGAMYFEGDTPSQYCSDRIEILGWRYRNEEPGKWHTRGGEIKVIRLRVKVFDIVSKFFKKLWEELISF